jgi:hypothetical protein
VGVKPAEPKDVPPLMMTASGESVTTVEQWEKTRRPEILETFRKNVYGVRKVERPSDLAFMEIAQPEVCFGGKVLRKRVRADKNPSSLACLSWTKTASSPLLHVA